MRKVCKECGESFSGRSDAKFCSDHCRSTFNNKNGANSTYVRKVNAILRKNHRILESLNPDGKSKVMVRDLIQKGYNFTFYTNTYTTKAGKIYYFCYDQGFIKTGDDWLALVTKHEYV